VAETNCIAGVMAHTLFPPHTATATSAWHDVSKGLLSKPLAFDYAHSLVDPNDAGERRVAPFYLNGGVVFYAQQAFSRFAPKYLELRSALMSRMEFNDFAGQAAFTLAVTEEGLNTLELPMRYNFPNDPRAETYQSAEMEHVIVHHYQHRGKFDRHKIFACAEEYEAFVNLDLSGINGRFQSDVITLFGRDYPFGPS
jgi:hypothetical protein